MAGFTPFRTVVGGDEEEQQGFQPLREISLGPAPKRNALAAGLSAGVDSLQGLGYSALGGITDAVGLDGASGWFNEQARRNSIDAGLNGRPDLERIEDQSLGSALPFVGYQIAKQVPLMGALLGAQAIPGVGQAAAATGLARLGAVAPRVIGGGGLRAGADFAARRAALGAGESLGSTALMGTALGYGSLYGESVEGGDPSPYLSALGAPLYGVMEAAVPAAVRGALRAPAQLAGGTGTRMLKAGGLGFVGEAGTELGQNELEMAMRNDLSDEEMFSRRLNAAAVGGIVGGPLGSLGGIRGPRTVDQGQFDLTDPEGGSQGGPARQLGYSPLAGTPIIFPDGTVALNGEQELQARFPGQVEPERGINTARVGEVSSPTTINVDPAGTAATTYDDTQALQDPAAELARQRYLQQRQTQERQQQDMQVQLAQTAAALQVAPAPNLNDAFDVLGGRVYGQGKLTSLLTELTAANRSKPPEQLAIERALVDSGQVSLEGTTGVITAKRIQGAVVSKIKQLQLMEARTPEQAAQILNDQIATMVASGKNEGDVKLGRIATVYEALTGQSPPALAAATVAEKQQTTGASNVSAPVSAGPAVAGGVGGGGADVQGSVAGAGPVDPQPGADGGNATAPGAADAQPSVLPGATGEQPSSVAPSATPAPAEDGYVDDADAWEDFVPQGGMRFEDLAPGYKSMWAEARARGRMTVDLAAAIAEEAQNDNDTTSQNDDIRGTLKEGFGERDSNILADVLLDGDDHATVANRYGVSRATVTRLVGGGETSDKVRGLRIDAAAKKLGWSQEYADTVKQTINDMATQANRAATAADIETDTATEAVGNETDGELETSEVAFGAAGINENRDPTLADAGFSTISSAGGSTGFTDRVADSKSASPEELAADLSQRAFEFLEAADARMAQIRDARAAGRDFIATKNRKLSLAEAVADYKATRRAARAQLDKAQAVLEKRSFALAAARNTIDRANATEEKKTVAKKQQKQPGTALAVVGSKKATSKAPATPQDSGQALWESLRKQVGDLVPYEDLTALERGYLTELADKTGGKPKLAKELGLQELVQKYADGAQAKQLTSEPFTIDVEAREITETETKLLTDQTSKLPEAQQERLEKHYGAKRGTTEFLTKLREDVANYVNKGAESVAGAIRSIIKAVAEGVLAVGLVFNGAGLNNNFDFNIKEVAAQTRTQTVTETVEIRDQVPGNAAAKMSPLAQQVYENMASAAKASGKGFIIADKPNGMIHVFNADGSVLAQDAALYGKQAGDKLDGKSKITPAGGYVLKPRADAEYAGGMVLAMPETTDATGYIAVHAAYLGDPKENRTGRLNSASADDNKISYGCINTAHDTFLKKILPNIEEFNGGMIFILPDAQEMTASMFPAQTETVTRTVQTGGTTGSAGTDTNRDQPGLPKQDKRTQTRTASGQRRRLFNTDLYLGKENVPGQPQYGQELRNPVTLANGTRLDGFTSPDQSVFSGYDRNGQRITVAREGVDPADIVSSRDSNRTAEALRKALTGTTRASRNTITALDSDGKKFDAEESTLDEITARFSGVQRGLDFLRGMGLDNAIDAVDSWMLTSSPVGWDAIYSEVDGKRTVVFNANAIEDVKTAVLATLHEVGHGIDAVTRSGGDHSSSPEFNLRRRNGEVVATKPGSVAEELVAHYFGGDSALSEMLDYPLNSSEEANARMGVDEMREELFAQAWAFSNLSGGMQFLRDNLPATAAFMEKVHAEVKQTNYARPQAASQGAQPGQVQGGAQALGDAVRASRQASQAPTQGLIQKNISKLPKGAQQPVRNILGALGDIAGKGLDYAVFTGNLVKRAAAAGLTSATKFERLIAASKSEAREYERAVEKIADMYALVPERDRGTGPSSVGRFLFDSTREGKWGFEADWRAKPMKADGDMKARFDALDPQTQAFVKAVFKHGDDMLALKKKTVLDTTTSEYDTAIAQAKADGDTKTEASLQAEKAATLKRFDTLFKQREGIPYAPIKRSGKYVVIAKSKEYMDAEAAKDAKKITELEKDGDHYHVSFVDSKWEARTLQGQLNEQGFFNDVQFSERDQATEELYGGASSLRELTKLRSKVDAKVADGDKSASKLLGVISQMYLEALAEGSARKSEMRRRGVDGEVDMLRSFAQQGKADANFLASLKYSPQVQDALQEMRNQAKSGDRERKSELLNELVRRYSQSLEHQDTPWINKLTRMSSIYFLATSPGYYLQNLTQPWMMSLPAMTGNHDYTKASGALFKAYGELKGVMASTKLFGQQFDFDKVPADVRDAIQELVNRGKIDIGLESEMGEFRIEGEGPIRSRINKVDKGLRLAVQKVESINRLSTAMAAYRLELARTGNKDAAVEYADRILTETHGDYTSFNAPRAFNTPVGKVALQFRKFQLIQLTFISKLIKEAGFSTKEQRAATKMLAFSLGHTALMAGVSGLPGYAAIAWALSALFGDDDEPFDLTKELRSAIGDETMANLVLRGAPTLAGADLSGKVGMGNMLSILPYSNADLSTAAGRAEALGTLVGGASLGMTTRMVDGLGLMLSGDYYKGLELTMPKGVSDAMKAYRQATDGMTRRNGDVVLPADEVSSLETIFTALGVPAVQQQVVYERQNRTRQTNELLQDRSTRIKNDFVKATREGDSEARAQAREAWMKLQEARARQGYAKQPMSELLKAPQQQLKRERDTAGGVQFNRNNRRAVEEQAAN